MPILVSTITTIVVFFPVLFLTGVARNLFMPLALTIAFALDHELLRVAHGDAAALPVRAEGRSMARRGARRCRARSPAGSNRSTTPTRAALGWVLRHRLLDRRRASWRVFGMSLFLKRCIGTEFFPDSDESQFSVNFKAPIGTRVERTEEVAERIESAVNATLASAGGQPDAHHRSSPTSACRSVAPPLFSQNTGPHAGNVQVNLVPRTQRSRSDVQAAESGSRRAARRAAGHAGLLFHRRHREAHPELRLAGADRRRDRRPRPRRGRGLREAGRWRACGRSRDKDGRPWLTDVQITREENYPELDVDRRSPEGRRRWGSPSSRSRRPCWPAWSATRSSRRFPSPTRRPATSTSSTSGWTTATGRTIDDLSEIFVRTPAGGMVPLDTVAQRRARQRAGGHQPQVPAAHHRRHRQRRAGQGPGRRERGGAAACSTSCRRPTGSRCGSAGRPRRSRRRSAT